MSSKKTRKMALSIAMIMMEKKGIDFGYDTLIAQSLQIEEYINNGIASEIVLNGVGNPILSSKITKLTEPRT